jgi:hypothetical protein
MHSRRFRDRDRAQRLAQFRELGWILLMMFVVIQMG